MMMVLRDGWVPDSKIRLVSAIDNQEKSVVSPHHTLFFSIEVSDNNVDMFIFFFHIILGFTKFRINSITFVIESK